MHRKKSFFTKQKVSTREGTFCWNYWLYL